MRLLIVELLDLFLQRLTTWFRQKSIRATWKSSRLKWKLMPRIKVRTFKYYKETALAINIRSEKVQFTKDRDLTFLYLPSVSYLHPWSHPRKVISPNSDQRRKCACAARGFVPGRNEALRWSFPGDSPCNGISSLPSPCTASFQALSVNAFRWRIRDERPGGA